jgi:hypothetical protein
MRDENRISALLLDLSSPEGDVVSAFQQIRELFRDCKNKPAVFQSILETVSMRSDLWLSVPDFVEETISENSDKLEILTSSLGIINVILTSETEFPAMIKSIVLMTATYKFYTEFAIKHRNRDLIDRVETITQVLFQLSLNKDKSELRNHVLKFIYETMLLCTEETNFSDIMNCQDMWEQCLNQILLLVDTEWLSPINLAGIINLLASLLQKRPQKTAVCLPLLLRIYENPPKMFSTNQLKTIFHSLRQQLNRLVKSGAVEEFVPLIRDVLQEMREKSTRKVLKKEALDAGSQPPTKKDLSRFSFDVTKIPIEWTIEIIIGSLLVASLKDVHDAIMGAPDIVPEPKKPKAEPKDEGAEDEMVDEKGQIDLTHLDNAMDKNVLHAIYDRLMEHLEGNEKHIWIQVITKVGVLIENQNKMDDGEFLKRLIKYLKESNVQVETKMECTLLWLFHEFVRGEDYSTERQQYVFSQMVEMLSDGVVANPDRSNHFGRFLRLSPFFEDRFVVDSFQQILLGEECSTLAYEILINSLCETIIFRPKTRNICLSIFLLCLVDEKSMLREVAIYFLGNKLLGCREVWSIVREFSLEQLQHLVFLDNSQENEQEGLTLEGSIMPINSTADSHPFARYLDCYLCLVEHNIELLNHLFPIYHTVSSFNRIYLFRRIEAVIKDICGRNEEIVCDYISKMCCEDNLDIILTLLKMVGSGGSYTACFVEFVKKLVTEQRLDGRFVLEIVYGMEKKDILHYLPHMFGLYRDKRDKQIVRDVLTKCTSPRTRGSLGSGELFVRIHYLEHGTAYFPAISIRHIVEILDIFWECREELLKSQDVASSLQLLLEKSTELPTTLMRTVIQAIKFYPSLKPFIISSIMNKLIVKKIWNYKHLWEGFVKCCQILQPGSLSLLLQLPIQQLSSILQTTPEFKRSIRQFLDSQPPSLRHRFNNLIPLLSS